MVEKTAKVMQEQYQVESFLEKTSAFNIYYRKQVSTL
jgi:hypothetical protein